MKTKSKTSGYIIRGAQKPLFFLLFASGLCSLWAQTPSPTPPTYLATDLGGLGGAGGASFAGGINNRGEVVGISFIPDVETGSLMRGFLYSGGLIRDLGTLGGGESRANGINDAGQIVGSSNTVIQVPNPCADPNDPNYDPDACQGVDPNAPYYVYPEHAFLYSSNGGMTDIGHDLGLADNYAYAINSSGQVAGTLFTEEDSTHAFRYSSNVLTDLDPNGNQSEGYAINDGGQVVGFAVSPEGGLRTAVFFNAATTFLGSGSSQGFSINSSGQVAGFAWVPSQHAVVYTDGVMADLGTLGGSESRAWGINSAGHVVGFAKTLNNADQHAFLYFGGAMYDLNNLVTGSTVPMLEARAINDSDQIAATGGPVNGQFHAFLLRPVVTATAGSNISSAVPADASYTMVAPI